MTSSSGIALTWNNFDLSTVWRVIKTKIVPLVTEEQPFLSCFLHCSYYSVVCHQKQMHFASVAGSWLEQKWNSNRFIKGKEHCYFSEICSFLSFCPCITINLPRVLTAKCFLTCAKDSQINFNSFDALLYQNWSQMFHRWPDRIPLLPNYHK